MPGCPIHGSLIAMGAMYTPHTAIPGLVPLHYSSARMRIFTRYILREVVSYALLGGMLFTFVLFMHDLPTIVDLLVKTSASLSDALRIFGDMLPNTFTVTIPTAVLAGILLGLSRLAADSEITAMRACGIGAFTFVRIISILAFAAFAIGLVNALYFAPLGAGDLLKLQDQLKTSQASIEIQPRVFYEDFKNKVLYVQDVRPGSGATVWSHVFLADLTQPANPGDVTTAGQAVVTVSGPPEAQTTRLHMLDFDEHTLSPTDPNAYYIQRSPEFYLPLQLDSQDDTHISHVDTPLHALSLRQLWQRAGSPANSNEARAARIELNSRFSYPSACLVLMLIGVPLGLSSRRGGKSTGFVLTLLLVFAYYLLSQVGVGLAKSGKLSPFLGVWGANLIFTALGIVLLRQLAGGAAGSCSTSSPPSLPGWAANSAPSLPAASSRLSPASPTRPTNPPQSAKRRRLPTTTTPAPPSSSACVISSRPASPCCSTSTSCAPTSPTSCSPSAPSSCSTSSSPSLSSWAISSATRRPSSPLACISSTSSPTSSPLSPRSARCSPSSSPSARSTAGPSSPP